MDKRQKVLSGAVIVLLSTYVLETFAREPWSTAMTAAADELKVARKELAAAEEKARREPEISKEWKSLKERLAAVKSEEAANRLGSFVDQLIKKHDLKKAALSPESAAPVAGSPAFREHALALSFQCSWESFVKLLIDLYAADEFVRIHRMGVQSHYLVEKESYLDINMRLSTISAAPEKPVK